MKFNLIKKIGIYALIMSMFLGICPYKVMAENEITVLFQDITTSAEAMPVLPGEAKIKVSAISPDNVTLNIAQLAFELDTDMEYKAIKYLINNPDGVQSSLQAGMYNNLLYAMAVYGSPVIKLDADRATDLFILTFEGDRDDTVGLELVEDEEESYFAPHYPVNSNIIAAKARDNVVAEAADEGAEAVDAEIKLQMNKVGDFQYIAPEFGEQSGIRITVIGEDGDFPVMFSAPVESTGAIPPTLVLNTKLIKGQTYTIEVSGAGYIPCRKTGYSFDNGMALVFTNEEFKPGELVEDGVIDAKDKAKFDEILAKAESDSEYYIEAADFNRDKSITSADRRVYAGISDIPQKLAKPTVTGGTNAITVSWTKPQETDITGYVIKYGIDVNNFGEITIDNSDTLNKTITGLLAGTTYFVKLAAKNTAGIGEYSDVVSAATLAAENPNPGGGGGGNSGGGGGGGGGAFLPQTGNSAAEFNDIGNYSWAKDAIYKLKEKGIISGTSATTFSPQSNIKRGDFILILTRMLGVSDTFETNFKDVPENSYYYNAIGAARAAGIAQGSGEDFLPDASITRQDLITLAYRAFLKYGYIAETEDLSALDAFLDNSLIAGYAKAPMSSMVGAGIIKGSDGNVNPLGNATRAEVAVMCSRLLELLK